MKESSVRKKKTPQIYGCIARLGLRRERQKRILNNCYLLLGKTENWYYEKQNEYSLHGSNLGFIKI